MEWRFLVDEDTDTDCADELVSLGSDATTVADTVSKGEPDPAVARYARHDERVLVTTDLDFLRPSLHRGLRVNLVTDAGATGWEIAECVAELTELAEDPNELRPVTWI